MMTKVRHCAIARHVSCREERRTRVSRTMKDAVLVLGGAFNPVHTQHVALLCLCKQELEARGRWNVIGGYFAVATDNYVLHKMKSRSERTIKLQHRLELVKEAIRDVPWLANSPFQEQMLQQHDGSAFALGQRLKRLMKDDRVQLLIVIGADRMVKKGQPIWRKSTPPSSTIRVGVGRVLNENIDLLDLWQTDLANDRIVNQNEFILLNSSVGSVSSSLVRRHLHEWFLARDDASKRDEIETDLLTRQSYIHSSTMNYIKEHRDDLYADA